jgi:hypothetical protein
MIKELISLVVVGLTLTDSVSAAVLSKTYNFGNISGGDTVGDDYNSYFTMDVTNDSDNNNLDDGFVTFFINNNAGILAPNAAIKEVAFDFTTQFSFKQLDYLNIGRVDFKTDIGNLPQANLISFNTDYGAVKNGNNANSIQAGERLGISFYYEMSSIENLRVGIHVGSLPNGASDSYISVLKKSTKQEVPESSTVVALGIFAALGLYTRGKKCLT